MTPAFAGLDFSGIRNLWQNEQMGAGKLSVLVGWQHGRRTDTSTALYQMMPVHARLALEEEKNGFSAGVDVSVVDRKSDLDPNRFEKATPGYTLIDLRAAYERGRLRVAGGADNLLNRNYAMPLGGVNFDDFMAGGRKREIKPLTGRGRSVYFALSAQF